MLIFSHVAIRIDYKKENKNKATLFQTFPMAEMYENTTVIIYAITRTIIIIVIFFFYSFEFVYVIRAYFR